MKIIEKLRKTSIVRLFMILLVTNCLWSMTVGVLFFSLGLKCGGGLRLTCQIITKNLILMPATTLVEEVLFRWLPMIIFFGILYIIKNIIPSLKTLGFNYKLLPILVIVTVSSIMFGFMHGNFLNLFIHGVSGVFFFLFYLRILFDTKYFGRWQMKPLLGSFMLHLSYNLVFYGIQLM